MKGLIQNDTKNLCLGLLSTISAEQRGHSVYGQIAADLSFFPCFAC